MIGSYTLAPLAIKKCNNFTCREMSKIRVLPHIKYIEKNNVSYRIDQPHYNNNIIIEEQLVEHEKKSPTWYNLLAFPCGRPIYIPTHDHVSDACQEKS